MDEIRRAILRHRYNELVRHVYTAMRMAKEHERMETDLMSANYWRGRSVAWKDALDLIDFYLNAEVNGIESEVQP